MAPCLAQQEFSNSESSTSESSASGNVQTALHDAPHDMIDGAEPSAKLEALLSEIDALSSNSYRERQLARWRLEQEPIETLRAIELVVGKVDHNAGAQLVSLLSSLAIHSEIEVCQQARLILDRIAGEPTYAGSLAAGIVQEIADIQEIQALQVLSLHGAKIGRIPLRLHNTDRLALTTTPVVLQIDTDFRAQNDVVQWIRFLQSVDTLYVEGVALSRELLLAVSQLSQLKNVKLRHVTIDPDDLRLLQALTKLEYLEIAYSDIDDRSIEVLSQLPVSQYMRLSGTQVTEEGVAELAEQLDSVEIFHAHGGFLGVGTSITDTVVSTVLPGSGAQQAGIMESIDKLTHIGNSPITNFEELRKELGRYNAGDVVEVYADRTVGDNEIIPMRFQVVLGEEPSKLNSN